MTNTTHYVGKDIAIQTVTRFAFAPNQGADVVINAPAAPAGRYLVEDSETWRNQGSLSFHPHFARTLRDFLSEALAGLDVNQPQWLDEYNRFYRPTLNVEDDIE